ncbi:hypothetical protein EJB05_28174, partial [Eragrostis curvula]
MGCKRARDEGPSEVDVKDQAHVRGYPWRDLDESLEDAPLMDVEPKDAIVRAISAPANGLGIDHPGLQPWIARRSEDLSASMCSSHLAPLSLSLDSTMDCSSIRRPRSIYVQLSSSTAVHISPDEPIYDCIIDLDEDLYESADDIDMDEDKVIVNPLICHGY